LPHCIDLPKDIPDKVNTKNNGTDSVNIVFTGDIYDSNLDALKNIINTMKSLPSEYKLTICTPVSLSYLQEYNIHKSENIDIKFVSREDVLSIQRYATILFLPLAFKSSSITTIELATMFPTKTIEYMVSGTPILVHAPSNYYVSKYAIEKGWGFVVDDPNPDSLKKAILRLTDDIELRQKLVQNAWQSAAIYDGNSVSKILQKYLGSAG